MVIIATMAVMLVGATTLATSESAFAGGGHGHKKSYEKSQATSQVNECGNGFYPLNVGCQNTASQIQGDENEVALSSKPSISRSRTITLEVVQTNFFLILFSVSDSSSYD